MGTSLDSSPACMSAACIACGQPPCFFNKALTQADSRTAVQHSQPRQANKPLAASCPALLLLLLLLLLLQLVGLHCCTIAAGNDNVTLRLEAT
jgi:hypothetical protein